MIIICDRYMIIDGCTADQKVNKVSVNCVILYYYRIMKAKEFPDMFIKVDILKIQTLFRITGI